MVKQVIVVRSDLRNENGHKIRTGKIAAQVAHASFKVFLDNAVKYEPHQTSNIVFKSEKNSPWDKWLSGSFTKVVVSCDSKDELVELHHEAITANLPCAIITDAGRTEFNGIPTKTCVAIGPAEAEEIDKITGHLKLL